MKFLSLTPLQKEHEWKDCFSLCGYFSFGLYVGGHTQREGVAFRYEGKLAKRQFIGSHYCPNSADNVTCQFSRVKKCQPLYLKAVVMISALMLDSRESNVTLQSTCTMTIRTEIKHFVQQHNTYIL